MSGNMHMLYFVRNLCVCLGETKSSATLSPYYESERSLDHANLTEARTSVSLKNAVKWVMYYKYAVIDLSKKCLA